MHGKSRVCSAISKLKVRARVEIHTKFFSAMIFISVLLGLMDFSVIVTVYNRPNSCCQQNPECLICLYYLQVCFDERVTMTV